MISGLSSFPATVFSFPAIMREWPSFCWSAVPGEAADHVKAPWMYGNGTGECDRLSGPCPGRRRFCRAMKRFVKLPCDKKEEMGRASHAFVSTEFDKKQVVEETLFRLYRKI